MACPEQCSNDHPGRQVDLNPRKLDMLPAHHRKVVGQPKNCLCCECVYDDETKRIFGFFIHDVMGFKWRPTPSLLQQDMEENRFEF